MASRLEDFEGANTLSGRVRFDGGWYLLELEADVPSRYAEAIAALGLSATLVDDPHVSVIKDEQPSRKQKKFGSAFVSEVVEVAVAPTLRHENGRHVWLDVYSPRLCQIREYFALPTLRQGDVYRVCFHATIARLDEPHEPRLRPQMRLTPRTHIDVETSMQHV